MQAGKPQVDEWVLTLADDPPPRGPNIQYVEIVAALLAVAGHGTALTGRLPPLEFSVSGYEGRNRRRADVRIRKAA